MALSDSQQRLACPRGAQDADDVVLNRSLWKHDGEDPERQLEDRKEEKNSKLITL